MKGPVSKDSLARYEQPSMLYDATRISNTSQASLKPKIESADSSRDTLESTQQRLNREVLEKFQNTSSRLSHHSYIAASQTGKYLFLAIMLPPYLCCYGVPKWLFSTLIPQAASTVKTQALRVGRFFTELSIRVADLMKGVLEQMLGDALRASRRQARTFRDFFKNFAKKQWTRLKNVKEKLKRFHSDIHRGIYNAFIKGRNALRKWLEERAIHVIEKIANIVKKILSVIFYPLDVFDRIIVNPIQKWLKARAQAAYAKVSALFNKIAVKLELIKEWIFLKLQPVVKFFTHYINKIYALTKKYIQPLLRRLIPVYTWIQKKICIAKDIALKITKRMAKTIQRPLQWVSQKFVTLGKRVLSYGIEALIRKGKRFKNWCFSPWRTLINHLAEKKAKKIAKRATRYRRLENLVKWIVQRIKAVFQWAFFGSIRLLKTFWTMCVWWIKWILSFPGKALASIAHLFWMCVGGGQRCIYLARMILAWSIAFYQLGMMHVREFSAFLNKA